MKLKYKKCDIQYAKANMTGCSIDVTCHIRFGILYYVGTKSVWAADNNKKGMVDM